MIKRAALVILFIIIPRIHAMADEKNIFFVEDALYSDLNSLSSIRELMDISLKGLIIQRCGQGEFAFFKSLSLGVPSSFNDNEVNGFSGASNLYIYGSVEKDGTYYVPSKVLFNGQTLKEAVNIYHIKDIKELDVNIKKLLKKEHGDIIICSWVRGSNKRFESYIMPFIYYNGKDRGVIYSNTTRNKGIIDYSNAASIINGKMDSISTAKGDIEKIYALRINSLKNKKKFLTGYGYLMGASVIINMILLSFYKKGWINYFSRLIIYMPLIILIEPILAFKNLIYKVLFIIIGSAIITFYKKITPFRISIIFLFIIYIDAFTSNYLLKSSLLSYEPSLGARFYGIGNEYLGIILAYTLIICQYLKKSIYIPYIWFLNSLLLIFNRGGNNFGGFLTCFIIGSIVSPPFITIVIMVLAFMLLILSQNHISMLFKRAFSGDFSYVIGIIKSKTETLLKLLRFNLWTELSIVSILSYIYIYLREEIKKGSRFEFIMVCVLVTIFNDSGIISCALLMIIYLNYIFYNISLGE